MRTRRGRPANAAQSSRRGAQLAHEGEVREELGEMIGGHQCMAEIDGVNERAVLQRGDQSSYWHLIATVQAEHMRLSGRSLAASLGARCAPSA